VGDHFSSFNNFGDASLREDDGTTSVEYAIMVGLIILVAFGSVELFGNAAGNMFANIETKMPK